MEPDSINKTGFYKWLKVGGIISLIPFVLAAGPLGGFFIGDFLVRGFNFPSGTSFILAALGFAGSARETVRMLKLALRIDKGA